MLHRDGGLMVAFRAVIIASARNALKSVDNRASPAANRPSAAPGTLRQQR
jgi:hypothetical protein